jgi:hypothetical protein
VIDRVVAAVNRDDPAQVTSNIALDHSSARRRRARSVDIAEAKIGHMVL